MLQRLLLIAIPAAVDAFVVVLDPWISGLATFSFLLASRRHFRTAVAVSALSVLPAAIAVLSRSLSVNAAAVEVEAGATEPFP
jgi:hypothetical protein